MDTTLLNRITTNPAVLPGKPIERNAHFRRTGYKDARQRNLTRRHR